MAINVHVDPEFKNLIPPISESEKAQLEESLKQDGCCDPLVLWSGMILDGHNRYEICGRLGIPFKAVEQNHLPDRDSAKIWIIQNQLARRNLAIFPRCELALKLELLEVKKAKERQREHGGTAPGKPKSLVATLPQVSRKMRDRLAKVAGVSPRTFDKAKLVAERAPEPYNANGDPAVDTTDQWLFKEVAESEGCGGPAFRVL